MLKKISYRILILVLILIVLNFIYKEWFFKTDLEKHSKMLELVKNVPDSTDIIYIGESSNITFRGDDVDKRPISDFINDFYPDLIVSDITKPASHAGIYKILLENISPSNMAKTIVVTLNLRSFNAQWIYSDLETPLQKNLVLLKQYPPLLNRFLLSFKAYDIKTEKEREKQFKEKWKHDIFNLPYDFQFKNVIEWDNWMATNGIRDKNGKYDYKQTELACHFIKTYGFQIDTVDNPRIIDFNEIINIAHKNNWGIVFNLLPENIEKAELLVGKDLVYLINENAQKLETYFTKRGVTVVNNLNKVEDDQFIDQNWTTEHYAEKGRKIIAKNVAESLNKWYKPYYKEVNYTQTPQTVFFNNCDDNTIWGQTHTITNEIAHSGQNASMTGNGNDYSITLEYSLKIIPDSIKNNISIEFWAFQQSLNQEAKIVIQAQGSTFSPFWAGYELKHDLSEKNKWIKYRKNIPIPDSIKQAGLIKIYVYNPSMDKLYIDDFKIEIKK